MSVSSPLVIKRLLLDERVEVKFGIVLIGFGTRITNNTFLIEFFGKLQTPSAYASDVGNDIVYIENSFRSHMK